MMCLNSEHLSAHSHNGLPIQFHQAHLGNCHKITAGLVTLNQASDETAIKEHELPPLMTEGDLIQSSFPPELIKPCGLMQPWQSLMHSACLRNVSRPPSMTGTQFEKVIFENLISTDCAIIQDKFIFVTNKVFLVVVLLKYFVEIRLLLLLLDQGNKL